LVEEVCIVSRDEILRHQFHRRLESFAPFYGRIFTKNILHSGLRNPYEKIRETRKLEFIHFVERKQEGRKPDKDSILAFMPRNLELKMLVQDFQL
jgi:hypothetical protein